MMGELHGIANLPIKPRRPWALIATAAVLLLAISGGLMYLIITGRTRTQGAIANGTGDTAATSSTTTLVPRRLDGVLVSHEEDAYAPRAVMVDNQVDARPIAGIAKANVVIEAPVEGGITRLMLLFDATTTIEEVGAVRSARPYFVDWAAGWKSAYFHCGGSPDALAKLQVLDGVSLANVDEMAHGDAFWRSGARSAPHNIYTKKEFMDQAVLNVDWSTTTIPVAWHFKESASSTDRGEGGTIKVGYGGSYTVNWQYEKDGNIYVRQQGKKTQLDKNDLRVEASNVVVIKTEEKVLDAIGRLQIRTTGSGEATLYRDGNKYSIRWQRAQNEPIHFAGQDGSEILLNRGKTWIEVTTDDRIFAGL